MRTKIIELQEKGIESLTANEATGLIEKLIKIQAKSIKNHAKSIKIPAKSIKFHAKST